MTSFITITNPETDPDAPLTSELAKKWRDNAIAIAECDNTAPVNQACWHPYNMVFANDGQTGRFYNNAVVSSVTSPTMVAGYDYLFRGQGLSHNLSGSNTANLQVNGSQIGGSYQPTQLASFTFYFLAPAVGGHPKRLQGIAFLNSAGSAAIFSGGFGGDNSALTTITFSWDTGSFDAGQLFMYRRRNYMS